MQETTVADLPEPGNLRNRRQLEKKKVGVAIVEASGLSPVIHCVRSDQDLRLAVTIEIVQDVRS